MPVTMQEIIPLGLCITTQDLMDTKRFQHGFCDNLILRGREKTLEAKIIPIKRELNSKTHQIKYLEGHKAVIINNIDKIVSLVPARYSHIDINLVSAVVENGKLLIHKILNADSFEKIAELEPMFKSKIALPVYDLYIQNSKRSKSTMI